MLAVGSKATVLPSAKYKHMVTTRIVPWDIDELRLPANDYFTITPRTTETTEHLIERLHNLERRVDYLEQKSNR